MFLIDFHVKLSVFDRHQMLQGASKIPSIHVFMVPNLHMNSILVIGHTVPPFPLNTPSCLRLHGFTRLR